MKPHGMLASLPDVGRITAHAGQVLFYPRHTPPGLFVVLAGVLRRFSEGTVPEAGCGDRLDAAAGAFVVPSPDEVGGPAFAGVVADTDVDLLFVPRSVVLERPDVARILVTAEVAVVPLRESPKRRGEAVRRRRAQ